MCDSKYKFNEEKGAQKAGHFTQLVWRDSKAIGVGVSNRQNTLNLNCTYVVVRYRNAGNILGLFTDEVQRGSFAVDMCEKIVSMAESAVQEADSSFDQLEMTPHVSKLHGYEVSQSQTNAKHLEKFVNDKEGRASSQESSRIINRNEVRPDTVNNSSEQGNSTPSKGNIGDKNKSVKTDTSNATANVKGANEAIKNFFDSQSNDSKPVKGKQGCFQFLLKVYSLTSSITSGFAG